IFVMFFINSKTKMNPNMDYAQVQLGHNNNKGISYGIIESEGIAYYLDTIRMLENAKILDKKHISEFKKWLSNYLRWLLESDAGVHERNTRNNHAIMYEKQVAAIAD